MHRILHISFVFFLLSVSVSAQTDTQAVADSLYRSARSKARKGAYKKGLKDFNKAKDLYESIDVNSVDVAKTYSIIGHLERRMAKHDSAIKNYEKAKEILFNQESLDTIVVITLYSGMGSVYRYLNQHERSLDYYYEGLRLSKLKLGETHFQVGFFYNNIGNTFDDQGDFESALEYYGLSKEILEKRFAEDHNNLSNIYNNYGSALTKIKRYEEAKEYFARGISIQKNSPDNRSAHLIIGLGLMGDVLLKQGRHREAVEFYEEALDRVGLSSLDEKDFDKVNSPEDCIVALAKISNGYNAWYEKTKDDAYLNEGKKIIQTADKFIEYLKEDFRAPGERSVLLKNSYPVYERAIAVILNEDIYSEEAFSYSEKSRNNMLREAVQETEAKKFAGIPDSLLAEEIAIKKRLTSLRKKKFDAENDSVPRIKINALDSRIAEINIEYQTLQDTFKQNYPDYFALKYESSTIPVAEVQNNLLQDKQALLEYFVGDEYIFAFVISQKNYQVFKIKKDFKLQDTISLMRSSIFEWRPRSESALANSKNYRRTASFLYDKLMRPIEKALPEKLIIVPGGDLGFLPFEALLTAETDSTTAMVKYPYLIKEKQISYSYSATLLREMLKNRNMGREVLAFAPSFGIEQDSLPSNLPYLKALKHNKEEVISIQKALGGRVFTGEGATLQNFLEIAPMYKILHLATHGKANSQADDFSYLAFTYILDSLDNELLYAGNLYNTELRADMVVLSACETGIGELQEGEGILSLARAFSYAGAKSIVTTLWSIDDKSSLEIMVDFYKNLEAGDRKDAALREAKLDFIYNNSRRAHPLFWAAYVPIGNMESIAIGRNTPTYYYVLAILLIALLITAILYLRKR